jgi:hypothetical protein
MRQLGGHHVQGVRGGRALARGVEHPLLDHVLRARAALLARLEHEDHVPGEITAPRAQQPRGPGQHGGVQVVPAGVHRTLDLGRVRQPGALGDRQGVHVAAQQHGPARTRAAEDGGHRAQRAAHGDLDRQPVQCGQHLGLGAGQVQADLRLSVEAMT